MTDGNDDISDDRPAHLQTQHRVRNVLAVVRSLVRRTARTTESVEDFEQHLDGRLAAYARIQTYLLRDPGAGMDLEMIVRDELLAQLAGASASINIEGPEIRLPARIAETFGQAIHELATNAIKYGALAHKAGRIAITWTVEAGDDGQALAFGWREHIADAGFSAPNRAGFGREMLDQAMRYELDAEPHWTLLANGVRYWVRVPL